MAEVYSSGSLPPARQAEQHYQKGLEHKASGNLEAALTEFRRAALSDSTHFGAQLEIGRLCKVRAQSEPIYYRHAFEAFRQAARQDLTHTEAHDSYIMAAQKLGRLDELLKEYDNWLKFNAENELIARCRKNILTISMAMMPDKVSVGGEANSARTRRVLIFTVVGILLLGMGIMGAIAFLKGNMKKLTPPTNDQGIVTTPVPPAPVSQPLSVANPPTQDAPLKSLPIPIDSRPPKS